MSVEKAELKVAVLTDVGDRVETLLEGSQAAVHRAEGAEQAFRDGAQVVQQLHQVVDREIDEKKLDLEQGKIAKDWITRAVNALFQLSVNAQQVIVAQKGHAQGVSHTVQFLQRLREQEFQTLAEHRARDVEAEHRSIKEERLAEEAEERASEPPAAAESVAPPNGAPRGKRRRKAAEQHGADA